MEKIFLNQTLDKNTTKKLLSWFLDNYSELRLGYFLDEMKSVGFHFATKAGFSLGFDDLRIPDGKERVLKQAELEIFECENDFLHAKINSATRYQRLLAVWAAASESLKDEVTEYFEETDFLNPLYMMAFSGARGNISQVRQLIGMRGLMSDSSGGVIDFPIRSNFREGLSVTEYAISCYGARKGLIDTALRTADSGYLTRRLVDVAQKLVIGRTDCGTNEYFLMHDLRNEERCDPEALLIPAEERVLGRLLGETLYFQDEKISKEQPYQPYAHPSDPSWQNIQRTSVAAATLSRFTAPTRTARPEAKPAVMGFWSLQSSEESDLSEENENPVDEIRLEKTREFSQISGKPVPKWFSTSIFKVSKESTWIYKNFLPRDVFIRTPRSTGFSKGSLLTNTTQQPRNMAPATVGNRMKKSTLASRIPQIELVKTNRSLSFHKLSNPVLLTVVDYESRGKKQEKPSSQRFKKPLSGPASRSSGGHKNFFLSQKDIWPNEFEPIGGRELVNSTPASFENEIGPGLLILRPIEMMILDESVSRPAYLEKKELRISEFIQQKAPEQAPTWGETYTKRTDVNRILGETSAKFSGGPILEKKYGTEGITMSEGFAEANKVGSSPGKTSVPNLSKVTEEENFQIYLLGVKNEEILPDLLEKVSEYREPDQGIPVRSALTCRPRSVDWNIGKNDDICQYCYGWNLATGRLVFIGEAVGILAAQSIGEPGTQLTMRTFHTGGVFSAEVEAKVFAPHGGFVSFSRKLPLPQFTTALGQKAFFITEELQVKISQDFDEQQEQQESPGPDPTSLGAAKPPVVGSQKGSNPEAFLVGSVSPLMGVAPVSAGKNSNLNFIQKYNEKSIHENFQQTEGKKLSSILELPPYSYVFIFPGQKIERNQVCAEISKNSGIPRKAAETFTKSKPVRLEIQGQIGRPEEEIRILENGEKKWIPMDPWEGKLDPSTAGKKSDSSKGNVGEPKIGFHQEYIWVFSGKPVSYPRITQSCDYISPKIGIHNAGLATLAARNNFLGSKGILSFEKTQNFSFKTERTESNQPKHQQPLKVDKVIESPRLNWINTSLTEKVDRSSLVSIQESEQSNFLSFLTYFQSSQKPFFNPCQGPLNPVGPKSTLNQIKPIKSVEANLSFNKEWPREKETAGQYLFKLGELWFGEKIDPEVTTSGIPSSLSGKKEDSRKKRQKKSLHRFFDSGEFEKQFYRLLFFLETVEPKDKALKSLKGRQSKTLLEPFHGSNHHAHFSNLACDSLKPFSYLFWKDLQYCLQQKKIAEKNSLFLRATLTKILISGVKNFPQFLPSFGKLWLQGHTNFDRSAEQGKLGIFGGSIFKEPLYHERWNYSLFDRWNKYYWTKSIQLFWPQKKYSDLDPMAIAEPISSFSRQGTKTNAETSLEQKQATSAETDDKRVRLTRSRVVESNFQSLQPFYGWIESHGGQAMVTLVDDVYQFLLNINPDFRNRLLFQLEILFGERFGNDELGTAPVNLHGFRGLWHQLRDFQVLEDRKQEAQAGIVQDEFQFNAIGSLRTVDTNSGQDIGGNSNFSEEGFDEKLFEFRGKIGTHQKAILNWEFRKWMIGGFNPSPRERGTGRTEQPGSSAQNIKLGSLVHERNKWAFTQNRDLQSGPQNSWSFAKKLHQRGWSKEMVKAYVSADPFFEQDEVPLTVESKAQLSELKVQLAKESFEKFKKLQLKSHDYGGTFDTPIQQESLLSLHESSTALEYEFKEVSSLAEQQQPPGQQESPGQKALPQVLVKPQAKSAIVAVLKASDPEAALVAPEVLWAAPASEVSPVSGVQTSLRGNRAEGNIDFESLNSKENSEPPTGFRAPMLKSSKFTSVLNTLRKVSETPRKFAPVEADKEFFLAVDLAETTRPFQRELEKESQKYVKPKKMRFRQPEFQSGLRTSNLAGGIDITTGATDPTSFGAARELGHKHGGVEAPFNSGVEAGQSFHGGDIVEPDEYSEEGQITLAEVEFFTRKRGNRPVFGEIGEIHTRTDGNPSEAKNFSKKHQIGFSSELLVSRRHTFSRIKESQLPEYNFVQFTDLRLWTIPGNLLWIKPRKWENDFRLGTESASQQKSPGQKVFSSAKPEESRSQGSVLPLLAKPRMLRTQKAPVISRDRRLNWSKLPSIQKKLQTGLFDPAAFGRSLGELTVSGNPFEGVKARKTEAGAAGAAPMNREAGSGGSGAAEIGNQISFDKSNQILRRTWLSKTYSLGYTLRLLHPYRTDFSRGNFGLREKSLEVREGEILKSQEFLFSQTYEETRTGDIVQGLPKIEQLFEARRSSPFTLVTLHQELKKQFTYFCEKFPPLHAARLSLRFIQRVLVDEIQLIYHEQGVDIHDKHVELIVRQMTRRVAIRDAGTTHFLPSSVVEIDILERYAASRKNKFAKHQKYSSNIADTGLVIEPVILGLTKTSLVTTNFLSAASFQEARRMLFVAATKSSVDFLSELKHDVLVGRYLRAGSTFHGNTRLSSLQKRP